jgi:hypothetical protein
MLVSRRSALLAGALFASACASESAPRVSSDGIVAADDGLSTGDLASDQGRLIVLFEIVGGTAPVAPVLLSFDERADESISLPRGPKNYALGPGEHSARVALHQSSCTVLGVPTDIGQSYHGRFTMLPNSTHYFLIRVDCSSVSTRSGARAVTTGTNIPVQFDLKIWAPNRGSRQVGLPPNGTVNFGPIEVGWWHAQVINIPANCVVYGIGTRPPGQWGVDTFLVAANGSIINYSATCS